MADDCGLLRSGCVAGEWREVQGQGTVHRRMAVVCCCLELSSVAGRGAVVDGCAVCAPAFLATSPGVLGARRRLDRFSAPPLYTFCCRMCRWGLLCKDVMLNVRVGGRGMLKALSMSGGGVKCEGCVARGFRLVMPA